MKRLRSTVGFVAAFCATALAHAQPLERTVRVGLLCVVTCDAPLILAFRDALGKLGWIEGRNLVLDARGAGGKMDQLPSIDREIVAAKPDLIAASTPQPAQAAINLKTAKAIGLNVPQSLLLRADEMIQ